LQHGSPASAALTTQSPTSRLPSTAAPVVDYDYDGGRRIKIIGGVVLSAYQWSTCADPPIYPVVCIALGFVQLGRGAHCRRMATKVGGAGLPTSYARAT